MLIAIVGFAGNHTASRLLVQVLMMMVYGFSGVLFWRLGQRGAAGAFALKSLYFVAAIFDPQSISPPNQSLALLMFGWFSSLVLGYVLIDVSIRLAQLRLSNVLKHMPDPLVARRLDGELVFCNERFAQMVGAASPASLEGKPVPLMAHDQDEALSLVRKVNAMVRAGTLHDVLRLERNTMTAHGGPIPVEVLFSTYTELGSPMVLAQIRDLSEHKKAEEERLRQAHTDPLTGLANRQFLQQQLDAVLWVTRRQGTQCAVLLIDLDHFKKINDTLGHEFGDEILRQISQALQAQLGQRDLLARLSGDEFALVLVGLEAQSSVLRVEAKVQAIRECVRRNFHQDGIDYQLDASIGVVLGGADTLEAGVLLQHAEVAMYEAKAKGRGNWCFFDSGMDERLAESLRIEAALRQAIDLGELHLHYQSIHAAGDAKVVKAEALLRWSNPQLGQVSPARFIPVAEESALILELGDWVLDEALRQLARWRAEGWHDAPTLSINVSTRQFAQPDFEPKLHAALQRHGLGPGCVELELTETLLVSDQDRMALLLQRLREGGVSLSLDDFGTGYSSLSYLARFHLDTVKIDRSFVMNLHQGNRNHSLVRAIIAMAHGLGLKVVAEGVETVQQQAILLAEGCDLLQGYLLGRPMPAAKLRAHAQGAQCVAPGTAQVRVPTGRSGS